MGKNKKDLKDKLIGLVETRLELLGYSEEDIIDMQLDRLSLGEILLASIGSYNELYNGGTTTKSDDVVVVVEYAINDKDISLIQSIQLYEVQKSDIYGSEYQQLSLVQF